MRDHVVYIIYIAMASENNDADISKAPMCIYRYYIYKKMERRYMDKKCTLLPGN